ncbi:hypothetical protein EG829_17620 [bacterium]|nr:hypothetical protein [bacterium]
MILIFLFLLLCSASYLLLRLVKPAGEIASPGEASGIEWVRSIYGWGEGPNEQLTRPASVAIASDGTILVPDLKEAAQVVRFNPDGTPNGAFTGGQDENKILFPTSIGVGPDDSIYIVQGTHENIMKLSPNGDENIFTLDVVKPSAIAAAEDKLVVGAKEGFAIIDPDGTPISIIGTGGSADDQFDTVSGVAIDDDGNIYVVDTYNNRISKYDPQGESRIWMVRTGNPGNESANEGGGSVEVETEAEAAMQTPGAAVIDGNGRLVVIDMLDFSLNVFDTEDGSLIAKYGTYGTEEGKFIYPSGLAYDEDRDWFAIADLGNDRVQIVRLPDSSDGSLLATARRTLAGPLRALGFPIVLLLLAIAYWVYRKVRERRDEQQATSRLRDSDDELVAIE